MSPLTPSSQHLPLRLAWADVSIYFLYCRGAHPLLARHNAEMTELLKALGVHGGEQDFYVQGPIMCVSFLSALVAVLQKSC